MLWGELTYVIRENLSTFSHRPIDPFALGIRVGGSALRQLTTTEIYFIRRRLIDVADLYEIDRHCAGIFLRLILAI